MKRYFPIIEFSKVFSESLLNLFFFFLIAGISGKIVFPASAKERFCVYFKKRQLFWNEGI